MLPAPSLNPTHRRSPNAITAQTRSLIERVRRFRQDEDGAFVVFTLYILLCMLMAVGMAIDTVRFENARAKLQNTLDRAVLAAASLDQSLDAEDVVEDYFKKAGLEDYLDDVDVDANVNARTVSATASAKIGTMFMDMVGIETLTAPASGTATESIGDLEIALVLDNSGSMRGTRLSLLKPAARDFIDAVARDDTETDSTTAISIVPFATQVSAGSDLLGQISTTADHNYSHCVTFEDADFYAVDMPSTTTYRQTGHFDRQSASSNSYKPSNSNLICPVDDSRHITPWSTDATYLKGRIDDMTANGWTSIEIGTKWGAALLDPSMRDVLTDLADEGVADDALRGQPFEYSRYNTMKVLVVMSDGANTQQYDIKDGYRNGDSPVYSISCTTTETYWSRKRNKWITKTTTEDSYAYYDPGSGPSGRPYWRQCDDRWYSEAGDDAERFTWPELWDEMRVDYFTDYIKEPAIGGNSSTYFNQIVKGYNSSTKNTRTSNICTAAKNAGVTIFTIGMDTSGQGDATLADCATAESYFYDVRSLDISTAFNAIARQINQLRLTQ
ncbi:TadE/TadG family type IV pilus assembly protein [Tropicimonas marinistellae]|uniref:TadE/TadG family type IV pilus assembly protein n=1 Tax=Tropicimonas marinistellae TaxID=1739787 RepID=UPI00082E1ECA|nr:TadE/TadG family type IV pilus assembly protein [Tropicimonas marinistellae]